MSIIIDVVSQFSDDGIKRARGELDKLAEAQGKTAAKISKTTGAIGAGLLAGAGAAAVGLFEIGSSFDDAFDNIRVSTGQTGPALEQLKNDMKAVATSVPASFDQSSLAISEFNKRLGLTGAPLQGLSSQVLELSRITKTDLGTNIEAVSSVMQNFGVDATQQSGKLDMLFRASQQSGLSVSDLAAQMSGAGVVLRQVGLSFDQSAAFLATLAKAGVDANDVMPALSKTLATAAKDGKDASTVFNETFNSIKNAPSDTAAAGTALEVFGAKAGPKLAAMIREGKLSFEDMQKAISGGSDTILGAGSDTQDFGEKLTTLKNRVFVALEPMATKVFGAIGDAVEKLAPKVEELTKWMAEHEGVVKTVAIVVASLGAAFLTVSGGIKVVSAVTKAYTAIQAALNAVMSANPIVLIVIAIAALVAALVAAYFKFDGFRKVVDTVWQAIQTAISFAWNNVIKPVFAAIVDAVQNYLIPAAITLWGWMKTAFENISTAIDWAWNNVIKPIWDIVWWYITEVLVREIQILWVVVKTAFEIIADVIAWAWNNVIKPAWDALSWVISNILIPAFSFLWNVVSAVFDAVGSIISWTWEHVIKPAFGAIGMGVGWVIGVFETIKDGVVGAISGVADLITTPFKTAFNLIADLWNNTVGKLRFEIPDWVPGIGGKGFDVPDIPKFATGGMFDAGAGRNAGFAMLHDGEMVLTPDQQRSVFAGAGGATVNINVNVPPTADKAAVGQSVVEAIRMYEQRSGTGWRS